jgi:Tfp pilus assembly protein PilO
MRNPRALLAALSVLLVGVLFWFLVWNPKQDEIIALDEQIAGAEAQQAELRSQIQALQTVRSEAPEVSALIAASEAIVPAHPALPSALRQLQMAATESNLTLRSVSPGRPQPVVDPAVTLEPGTELVSFDVAVIVEGHYFQVVDFLRRVEDPAITPRGLRWTQLAAGLGDDDYPVLTVDLVGRLYSVLPAGGTSEPVTDADPADGDGEVTEPEADPATDAGSDEISAHQEDGA